MSEILPSQGIDTLSEIIHCIFFPLPSLCNLSLKGGLSFALVYEGRIVKGANGGIMIQNNSNCQEFKSL